MVVQPTAQVVKKAVIIIQYNIHVNNKKHVIFHVQRVMEVKMINVTHVYLHNSFINR